MENNTLSVSQVNEYIRSRMDDDPLLVQVAVRGEISNYKLYPSGHHYFTLKDEGGSLRCVLFKGNAFRMRFRPENGMQIIAFGKISVYPRDGAYQLYCTALTLDGVGDLHAAFEQLKKKLQEKGLFEQSHKKPIPHYPATIGIITSAAGAAVHDMIRILNHRFPISAVRLLPVRVQGVEAPGEIAEAIAYANRYQLADVLIVGRGGGSVEDLWAFNEEIVAQAIYDSQIPIISAVGHEPDVTISDFVADLRAATPSNAAELAVPDQNVLRQTLDGFSDAMTSAFCRQIHAARVRLDALSAGSSLHNPLSYVESKRQMLRILSNQLFVVFESNLNLIKQKFLTNTAKLDALSPLKVLSRGYAVTRSQDGRLISSVSQTEIDDCIRITVSDGSIIANVTGKENVV